MNKVIGLFALSLCAYSAFAEELPSKNKMDAVHACIVDAGIDMPKPGEGKPPKFTKEEKEIVDHCFEKNGVERPSKKTMESIHKCISEEGFDMPKPGEGKLPELTEAQKEIVDDCFEKNGLEPPINRYQE